MIKRAKTNRERTGWNKITRLYVGETDSTNEYLRRLVEMHESIPSGCFVRADYQTDGRGQLGNKWEAEAGQNLLCSVLLRHDALPARDQFLVSEVTCLSLKSLLDKYFIPDITIKWPNDIYYKDRKLAGILIENYIKEGLIDYSIIGIGVNVNQMLFYSDAANPVSMAQIKKRIFDVPKLMERYATIFMRYAARLNNISNYSKIHADYRYKLYRRKGVHRYKDKDGVFEATLNNVEPDGRLVLRRIDGRILRFAFKEIAFLPDYSQF